MLWMLTNKLQLIIYIVQIIVIQLQFIFNYYAISL